VLARQAQPLEPPPVAILIGSKKKKKKEYFPKNISNELGAWLRW
jgi:hypothetical protein